MTKLNNKKKSYKKSLTTVVNLSALYINYI